MTNATDELDSQLPTPIVDPPEPERPDELDTVSPGLTDESGTLPAPGNDDANEADTDQTGGDGGTPPHVATEEPTA